MSALQQQVYKELKQIRILASKSIHSVARILHSGVIDMNGTTAANNAVDQSSSKSHPLINSMKASVTSDFVCIAEENSPHGDLTSFMPAHPNLDPNVLFTPTDLQNIVVTLIETLIPFHDLQISHRDIRPCNILVADSVDKYDPRRFENYKTKTALKNQKDGFYDQISFENVNNQNKNINHNENAGNNIRNKSERNNNNNNNNNNMDINSNSFDNNNNHNNVKEEKSFLVLKLSGFTPPSLLALYGERSVQQPQPDICKYLQSFFHDNANNSCLYFTFF